MLTLLLQEVEVEVEVYIPYLADQDSIVSVSLTASPGILVEFVELDFVGK